jgi:hypothetical protein
VEPAWSVVLVVTAVALTAFIALRVSRAELRKLSRSSP